MSQIMAGEDNGGGSRAGQIRDLLKNTDFQAAIKNSDMEPVIFCGDFNSPSHLDWIEDNRYFHGDWVVEWPATKLLMDGVDLKDSYREIHPDVVADPACIWSAIQKFSNDGWNYTIPEPQDRIDFIFYRSARLTMRGPEV